MQLNFYFDYISPNAYLAWTQLQTLIDKYSVSINPVPVLFTGLLRASGQMGPAEQPCKRDWMSKNIARKAVLLDIPLKPPVHHPFNPLLVLRLSSLVLNNAERWKLIDTLMKAIWAEQVLASDEQGICNALDAVGFNGQTLIQQSQSENVAQKLKQQTEHAISQGIFGIPSIIYQRELFFGYDDFVFLEKSLSGEDPINESPMAQEWINTKLTPSSMRKEFSQQKKPSK